MGAAWKVHWQFWRDAYEADFIAQRAMELANRHGRVRFNAVTGEVVICNEKDEVLWRGQIEVKAA